MTAAGLINDEIYLRHDTGSHHPEKAERLTAILKTLEDARLFDKLISIKLVPAERSVLVNKLTVRKQMQFCYIDQSIEIIQTM